MAKELKGLDKLKTVVKESLEKELSKRVEILNDLPKEMEDLRKTKENRYQENLHKAKTSLDAFDKGEDLDKYVGMYLHDLLYDFSYRPDTFIWTDKKELSTPEKTKALADYVSFLIDLQDDYEDYYLLVDWESHEYEVYGNLTVLKRYLITKITSDEVYNVVNRMNICGYEQHTSEAFPTLANGLTEEGFTLEDLLNLVEALAEVGANVLSIRES